MGYQLKMQYMMQSFREYHNYYPANYPQMMNMLDFQSEWML